MVLQAPAKPRSPVGQMVTYYLKMEPHLFKDALDEQFQRLADERQEAEKLAKEQKEQQDEAQKDKADAGTADGDMVLYRCSKHFDASCSRLDVICMHVHSAKCTMPFIVRNVYITRQYPQSWLCVADTICKWSTCFNTQSYSHTVAIANGLEM